jgi:class 3 adenylate cyclase
VQPETRYAKSGDVHIAYQVVGEGALDLVFVPGLWSHVEFAWEEPSYARFLRRLASFSRLIMLDKRGTGLSDRVVGAATLEERMDDIRAVMDAVGSERAAILGWSEGGGMALLFAATHPDRTQALVLYGVSARATQAPDYPHGLTREAWESWIPLVEASWGGREFASIFLATEAPSRASDERFLGWWERYLRLGASPAAATALLRMNAEIDLRPVLPTIHVPTLVLHRTGDLLTSVEGGRYVAERIPGARFIELPGVDHLLFVGDTEAPLGEIEEFLTGVRQEPDVDRVLATVLFTDVVDSTRIAAEIGDRRWRDLLEGHQALVRRELARFRGREVKTLGDGFLVIFDGPARAIRCACAVRDGVRPLGIEIRAGLHTGECDLTGDDVGGIAVHIGARVAASATPGEVLVSSTVKDLVAGSGLRFVDRGAHTLHGVPGEWRLFGVEG